MHLQGGLAGPGDITPFHLAALLPEAEPTALLLCTTFGAHKWFTSLTQDGKAPANFASQCGKHALNHAMSKLLWQQQSASIAMDETETRQEAIACGQAAGLAFDTKEQPSVSVSDWSESGISSTDDDSGSDVEASRHDGSMCVVAEAVYAPPQGISVAAGFLRDKKAQLAAALREASWLIKPKIW